MKKFGLLAIIGASFLCGCAQSANDIPAAYISPITYQSYTCSQIREEAQRLVNRVAEATGVQNGKATSDAVAMGVGVVIFFPALFFVKGNSTTAPELGRLKGEMQALEQAAIQKNCHLTFQAAPPV